MTTTFRPALLAIVAATLAQGAVAQPPLDRDPAARLKRADADGDGKVSRDEFIKARTAESEAAFARLDADGNGTLDDKEIGAAAERMRPGRRPDGDGPRRPDGTGPEGERPPRRPFPFRSRAIGPTWPIPVGPSPRPHPLRGGADLLVVERAVAVRVEAGERRLALRGAGLDELVATHLAITVGVGPLQPGGWITVQGRLGDRPLREGGGDDGEQGRAKRGGHGVPFCEGDGVAERVNGVVVDRSSPVRR